MSDFADLYGGGGGSTLLPGGFGGFRTGWAYPVPVPNSGADLNRNIDSSFLSMQLGSSDNGALLFTPFFVPPGAQATTSRIWCRLRAGDHGTDNRLRFAIYQILNGPVLTRVSAADAEIIIPAGPTPAIPWSFFSAPLTAALVGGAQGSNYVVACNVRRVADSGSVSLEHCARGGGQFRSPLDPFPLTNLEDNPLFALQSATQGVPYTGSTLPALSGGSSGVESTAIPLGWGLRGTRTYGAFPSTLDITTVANLSVARAVVQYYIGF